MCYRHVFTKQCETGIRRSPLHVPQRIQYIIALFLVRVCHNLEANTAAKAFMAAFYREFSSPHFLGSFIARVVVGLVAAATLSPSFSPFAGRSWGERTNRHSRRRRRMRTISDIHDRPLDRPSLQFNYRLFLLNHTEVSIMKQLNLYRTQQFAQQRCKIEKESSFPPGVRRMNLPRY